MIDTLILFFLEFNLFTADDEIPFFQLYTKEEVILLSKLREIQNIKFLKLYVPSLDKPYTIHEWNSINNEMEINF